MSSPYGSIWQWREQYARPCLRLDFEPLIGSTFHASVKPIFPELRIVRTALSPGFLFRDEDLLQDDDDRVGFIVADSGELIARHLDREVRLARGDGTLMLMNATGGVGWRKSIVLFDMLIPPAEWESRGARPEEALMQRLWRKSEGMQLLHSYLRSLQRIGLAALGSDHKVVQRHIIDLAVLATTIRCPIGESDASAVVATRQAAALDYLALHFSDPELSLPKVARGLRISPRYLQRLLKTSGTSFTAHVTELRLKQAFTLLAAEGCKSQARICDVAMQAGFSDISRFNRLFRFRFGDTPSGVRAQALSAARSSSKWIKASWERGRWKR